MPNLYSLISVKKTILILAIVLGLVALSIAASAYYVLYAPNVAAQNNNGYYELYVPTGATYQTVVDTLRQNNALRYLSAFDFIAHRMNYPNKVKPGRYLLRGNMGNRAIVNLLRSGNQTPLDFTIHNIRTKSDLVHLVGKKIEADTIAFMQMLNDTLALDTAGFTPDNVLAMFMADTYQINWNTNSTTFFKRMYDEYNKFWTTERQAFADSIRLTPQQVVALAAIVEEEIRHNDEMPRIAGVYLNRLRTNMPLQADPTVRFAVGNFALQRLLKEHTEIKSPYNTYRRTGLPPGPIRIPSKLAIESTLHPEKHEYLYFCAKEDFSGYSNFAVTYQDHLLNARKYRDELDRRGIK